MPRRKHLIIGCGSAGLSALEQIRRLKSEDEIKVVSMEDSLPYSPTLLPYILSGKVDEANLPIRTDDYFNDMKAGFAKGKKVTQLLHDKKQVVYEDGEQETYDTLLIASGSEPAKPPINGLDENTFLGFHTIKDCQKLLEELEDKKEVAVLGAGLVGMEVATSLIERGYLVTVVEKEPCILPLYFDQETEALVRDIFLNRGAKLLTGREVSEVHRNREKIEIGFSHSDSVSAAVLVCCTGVKARTTFLRDSGVAVNNGILVDRRMMTNIQDIYAAGDVAEAQDFFIGQRGMNPTIPSAVEQGKTAGSNMAGEEVNYKGWVSANVFNFFGNRAFSVGLSTITGSGYQVFSEKDDKGMQLKKLVYHGDKLVGAQFLNFDVDPGLMLYLIENQVNIGDYKQILFDQPKEISRWLMLKAEGM